MAVDLKLAPDAYSKIIVDVAGGGVTYYGVSNFANVTTSTAEWAILRETVVGSVTTYEWAEYEPKQVSAWDDRATLTY